MTSVSRQINLIKIKIVNKVLITLLQENEIQLLCRQLWTAALAFKLICSTKIRFCHSIVHWSQSLKLFKMSEVDSDLN